MSITFANGSADARTLIQLLYRVRLTIDQPTTVLRLHWYDYVYLGGQRGPDVSIHEDDTPRPLSTGGMVELTGNAGIAPPDEVALAVRLVVGALVEVEAADGMKSVTELWFGADVDLSTQRSVASVPLAPIDKPADLGIAFDG